MTTDGHNRRHIRDIAHLYLSRAPNRRFGTGDARRPLTLLVAATDSGCFPGFHIANLAAALCARGHRVNVVERSGIVPNTAYFLALPPRVHLGGSSRLESEWVSAMAGIRVAFASRGDRVDETTGGDIEIMHLPPLWDGDKHPVEGGAEPRPILLIASGHRVRSGEIHNVMAERYGPSAWRAILYTDSGPKSPPQEFLDLGTLPVWRNLLTDRVPAVMRDPNARVAKSYKTVCDELMGRMSKHHRSRNEPSSKNAGTGRSV